MNISRALAISDYDCGERRDELTWLAEQAATHKAIVEIGAWKGCSTRALADNTTGQITAVDTFLGTPSEDEMRRELEKHEPGWLEAIFRKNIADLTNVRVMAMSSSSAAWALRAERFDMIFIDADHNYEAVKSDILAWMPKLVSGGIIAGHDRTWTGVKQSIDELVPHHRVATGAIWYAIM